VRTGDIPFRSDFELRVQRDDHIHALVVWFDIDFDASHKPVRRWWIKERLLWRPHAGRVPRHRLRASLHP